MSVELSDVFRAARLIQWGLQPRVRPIQNIEYRELIREYMNRSEFRDVVAELSDGLGLYVLPNVSEHGIVLSPTDESVFWMKASEFRPGNSSADMRLLDGLIQITIAATIFPRARDLEDDVNRPRPPVTVEEIDDSLRAICARLKEEFADEDPQMDDIRTGLYDAWRVYDNMLSVRETKDGRDARNSTTRAIKYNLERLKEFGCFTETRYAGKDAWQATRRYNVLVQELVASELFEVLMKIKNGDNAIDDEPMPVSDNPNLPEDATPEELAILEWGSEYRDDNTSEHSKDVPWNVSNDEIDDNTDHSKDVPWNVSDNVSDDEVDDNTDHSKDVPWNVSDNVSDDEVDDNTHHSKDVPWNVSDNVSNDEVDHADDDDGMIEYVDEDEEDDEDPET